MKSIFVDSYWINNNMRKVLATDLSIWPDSAPEKVLSVMMANSGIKIKLANYLLLYDQIVIPSGNLLIVQVLRQILGEGIFDDLIRNHIIIFARYSKWIGYAPRGLGLTIYSDRSNNKFPLLSDAYFLSSEEAIDTVFRNGIIQTGIYRSSVLKPLILENTIDIDVDPWFRSLKDETHKDINESPYLREHLGFNRKGQKLNELKGIKNTQFRIHGLHTESAIKKGAIDILLDVAFENFLLRFSSALDVSEITADSASLSLLRAKSCRAGIPTEQISSFVKIQGLENIPDIGTAFSHNQISIESILKLRESSSAIAFRAWLSQSAVNNNNAENILSNYMDTITAIPKIDSIPYKLLRFVGTSLASILGDNLNITSTAASLLDNFVLNKWFPNKSPRFFIEDIKSLSVKDNKNVNIPNPKKLNLN